MLNNETGVGAANNQSFYIVATYNWKEITKRSLVSLAGWSRARVPHVLVGVLKYRMGHSVISTTPGKIAVNGLHVPQVLPLDI